MSRSRAATRAVSIRGSYSGPADRTLQGCGASQQVMAPSPRPRRRIGTRELVIAFAIVEAAVLLWLVTHTTRRTQRAAAPAVTSTPATDARPRP